MKGGTGSLGKFALLLLLMLVIVCAGWVWHSIQVSDATQGLNSEGVSAQSSHGATVLQMVVPQDDSAGREALKVLGRSDPNANQPEGEMSEGVDRSPLQYMELTAPELRTVGYRAISVGDDWLDFIVDGDGVLGLGDPLEIVPAQFLLRRGEGAAVFAATREDLSMAGALPLEGAPVEIVFVPEFPEGLVEGHDIYIWPQDESAATLRIPAGYRNWYVSLPKVPFSLEPVSWTEARPMKQRMLIRDLHEGLRYTMGATGGDREGISGPLLFFDSVEFTPPASLSVTWRLEPGVHVRIVGESTAAKSTAAKSTAAKSTAGKEAATGTIHIQGPVGARATGLTSLEIKDGTGWANTTCMRDGEYEVWAEGADWASASPRTRITLLDGVPDVEEVLLSKVPRRATARVRFNLSEDVFEGAYAMYTNSSGEQWVLPKLETPSTPARVRWEFPHMLVTDILEPIDLAVFFPKAGALACLLLAPGDNREIELTAVPPRLFTKAQDVARALLDGPSNPRQAILQMEVCSSGGEPRWLFVKSFNNLTIPGYLSDRNWTLPAPESARYRLRVYIEDVGWEVFPIPKH